MNQKELDAIKERCDKATLGPWYTWADWMVHTESDVQSNGIHPSKVIGTFNKKNADFIAHARQDIPTLLAEVERLQLKLSEFGTIRAQLQTASFSTNKGAEDLAKFILQIWPDSPKEG